MCLSQAWSLFSMFSICLSQCLLSLVHLSLSFFLLRLEEVVEPWLAEIVPFVKELVTKMRAEIPPQNKQGTQNADSTQAQKEEAKQDEQEGDIEWLPAGTPVPTVTAADMTHAYSQKGSFLVSHFQTPFLSLLVVAVHLFPASNLSVSRALSLSLSDFLRLKLTV